MPSVRPPRDDGGQALGGNEFERLCEKVVGRIARRDIGRMWDEAVDRDAAGQVTAEKHGQLIEFFYLTCVLVGMAGGGEFFPFLQTPLTVLTYRVANYFC